MYIGCNFVRTHLGQTIIGNLSTKYLIISKPPPPLPRMTEARNTVTLAFDVFKISPTSCLLDICLDISLSGLLDNPPTYIILFTLHSVAASAKFFAILLSNSANLSQSFDSPSIE